jgi:hypothetical protein
MEIHDATHEKAVRMNDCFAKISALGQIGSQVAAKLKVVVDRI